MNFEIKLIKKKINTSWEVLMETDGPYEKLGPLFWDYKDVEAIEILRSDIEQTILGKWQEPLPLSFGSGVTTAFVYTKESYIHDYDGEFLTIPTEDLLLFLNIWLNFIKLSRPPKPSYSDTSDG